MKSGKAGHPPGPFSLSPMGLLPELPSSPLPFVSRLWQTYGDVVAVPVQFYQKAWLVNDPALVYEVLVKQARVFEKPPIFTKVFSTTLGQGLFFSDGRLWQRQRRLAQPAFRHKNIEAYAGAMLRLTEAMLATWEPGQPRNIAHDMQTLTLHILTEIIFKTDLSADSEALTEALRELSEVLTDQAQDPLRAMLADSLPWPDPHRARLARLDRIVYRLIQARRDNPTPAADLVSVFLNAVDEDTGQPLPARQVRDEVVTLFMAGHETTASTLGWMWALLARQPRVEARLHAELDAVLDDGRPARLADLPRLPYTEAVVKETLRLYPATWILYRRASKPLSLGGYHLPAGTVVWLTPYLMHRHPHYYDQPLRFCPERFLPEGDEPPLEKRLPRFAYYPFGGGPRVCLGNGLAMLQLRLVLATVARRYRMRLLPGCHPEPAGVPGLGFKHPVLMHLTAR